MPPKKTKRKQKSPPPTGKSQQPPKKMKSIAKSGSSKKGACICNWDSCKKLFKVFNEKLDDNHPWHGELIRCKPVESKEKTMAFANAVHLIFKRGEVSPGKTFMIARHHFSPVLLKLTGRRTTPLTRIQAKQLDDDANIPHKGYETKKWTMKSLLKSNHKEHKDQLLEFPL